MIFSVPNLEYYVTHRFVNALNFEHTYYLTEPAVEYLLADVGYSITSKEYYENHSIFYAAERVKESLVNPKLPGSLYEKNRDAYLSLIEFYQKEVRSYNDLIKAPREVYLFGAHIFPVFIIYGA